MRLPWDELEFVIHTFIRDQSFSLLGCLSFEDRCCAAPERLSSSTCKSMTLIDVRDPKDAFPCFEREVDDRVRQNLTRLETAGVRFKTVQRELLAADGELFDSIASWRTGLESVSIAVLDITCLPKRFFCFFLKHLLSSAQVPNLIVTYTEPGPRGHAPGQLSFSPLHCDPLPGFIPGGTADHYLVICAGFEALNIKSIIETYASVTRATKVVVPFPPNGVVLNRSWSMIRRIVDDADWISGNLEVVPALDAECLYETLVRWGETAGSLLLAPFGPKPHTLGMALFATQHGSGMCYTQPTSYNPNYTTGAGNTWAYVAKWGGVPCYERAVVRP